MRHHLAIPRHIVEPTQPSAGSLFSVVHKIACLANFHYTICGKLRSLQQMLRQLFGCCNEVTAVHLHGV
jgi:hypothetical protein